MGIGEAILFSLALTVDVFLITVGLGTLIPKANIIRFVALFIALLQSMILMAGYVTGKFLIALFGAITTIAGSILLVWIGVRLVKEAGKSSYLFFRKNILFIYLGIGVENFFAGVSIGTTKNGWVLLFSTFFLICFGASFLALYTGRTFRRRIRFPVGQITGFLLIVIGIKNFFEVF